MRKVIIVFAAVICLETAGRSSLRAQSQSEGQKLYSTYCSACHGDKGKGDGAAARSLPVKPVDHTDGRVMNQFSDKYLVDIISKGGSGVGKSAFMPGWAAQLKEKEIREIVGYLRSIADPPYRTPSK